MLSTLVLADRWTKRDQNEVPVSSMEEILEIVSIFAPEARGGRSESRGRKVGGRAEERADQVMDERPFGSPHGTRLNNNNHAPAFQLTCHANAGKQWASRISSSSLCRTNSLDAKTHWSCVSPSS